MSPEDDLYMFTRDQLISGGWKVLLVGAVLGGGIGFAVGVLL